MSKICSYNLISLLLVVDSIASISGLDRCCKTGGIIRYLNMTIACIPALLPDSLNVYSEFLSVTPEIAANNFENDTEGYVCRDIVFDELSGLALKTQINVSVSANMDRKFVDSVRYDIRKCCNNEQYFNINRNTSRGCCTERPDMQRYDYVMTTFAQYYRNKYKSDDDCHSMTCKVYQYFIQSQLKLYVLGDEVTESPYFKHPLVRIVVSEMESTKYCASSELDPVFTWYSWCTEKSTVYGQLKLSLDKIFMDLRGHDRKMKTKHDNINELGDELIGEEENCKNELRKLQMKKKELEGKSKNDKTYHGGRKRYDLPFCELDKNVDDDVTVTPTKIAIEYVPTIRYAITLDKNVTNDVLGMMDYFKEFSGQNEKSVFNCSEGAHFYETVSVYDSGKIIYDTDRTAKLQNYCLVYNQKHPNRLNAYVCSKSSKSNPTWFLVTIVCFSFVSKAFLLNIHFDNY